MPRPAVERRARSIKLRVEKDARLVALAAELNLSVPDTIEYLIEEHDGVRPPRGLAVTGRVDPDFARKGRTRVDRDREEVTPRLKGVSAKG